MPSSKSAFEYLSNLPGTQSINAYKRNEAATSPTAEVERFRSQALGELISGQAPVKDVKFPEPRMGNAPTVHPSTVQGITQRTTNAVRDNSQRMLQNAQLQRQRRNAATLAKTEQAQRSSGGGVGVGYRRPAQGGAPAPQGGGGHAGGHAVSRIQGMLGKFPGLRITETLGNRDYDVAHGVARVPTSYHYDSGNPAVDIAGSNSQLWALYNELVRQGGWRQILWQVPGHYDHIHVAAEGGVAGDEEFDIAVATSPEEIPESDTIPTLLTPGEGVLTPEATERVTPEGIEALNNGAGLEDVLAQQAPAAMPGMDVAGLVSMAYKNLSPAMRQHVEQAGANIPGIRTSVQNLQPGDLVAWKDGSHIAVYAGNGEVMERGDQRRKLWAPESAVFGIALRLPGE